MTDPAAEPAAEPEQSELEQATAWLEKLTHDPMADAVRGRVRVVVVSSPSGRGRYQECNIEMIVSAPGVSETPVTQAVVFSRKRWPAVGMELPARVSVAAPEHLEVVWDAMR